MAWWVSEEVFGYKGRGVIKVCGWYNLRIAGKEGIVVGWSLVKVLACLGDEVGW